MHLVIEEGTFVLKWAIIEKGWILLLYGVARKSSSDAITTCLSIKINLTMVLKVPRMNEKLAFPYL